jgi:peptidyl-prolyl cis-trans isomerase D
MLQKMGESIRGVITWIVAIIIVLVFLLFGMDYYFQDHNDNSNIVAVNGETITKSDLDVMYNRSVQMQSIADITPIKQDKIKQDLLEQMIKRAVSLQAAKNEGFSVSRDQVNAAITHIPQFQEDGHFSQEKYLKSLRMAMLSQDEFFQSVSNGMLLNQQRFTWIGTAFAMPNELEEFVNLYLQVRDYAYLMIPVDKFLKYAVVSKAEITDYYNQHKNSFQSPEKVKINYIEISLDAVKNQTIATAEDLETYASYETVDKSLAPEVLRTNVIAQKAQKKYKEILEEITDLSYQDPDSLAPLAKVFNLEIHTSDVFSRDGGDTELTRNPDVVNSAFSYEVLKLGNNSEVIELNDNTAVVLRLSQHTPVMVQPLADVENSIRMRLLNEKAVALATKIGKNIAQNTVLYPGAVNVPGVGRLSWHNVANAGRDKDDLAMANEIAFSLSTVGQQLGKSMSNGDFIIVRLNKIKKGQIAKLDKEQLSSILQQVSSSFGLMDYDLYVNGLLRKADLAWNKSQAS